MTTFPWNALPAELQTHLLHSLDPPELATVCCLNKSISVQAMPLLWRSIDFKTPNFEIERWHLEEMLQRFFLTCYLLKETKPDRWRELAAYVHCLKLVKVPDMQIGKWVEAVPNWEEEQPWPFPTPPDSDYYKPRETVWDTICCFRSLEILHIYIQQSYMYDIRVKELAEKMQGALPHLKRLKIGGDVTKEMILALLSTAHQKIEELGCIALLDGTVGQDYHSRGLLYLDEISSLKPFPNLRSLHLCKLAELAQSRPDDEDEEYTIQDSGVPWQWREDDDLNSLADWAGFIRRTSDTLESLTLEDCYLVGRRFRRDQIINPGGCYAMFPGGRIVDPTALQGGEVHDDSEDEAHSDPEDIKVQDPDPPSAGASSRLRFRRTLLPILAEQAWPKLKKLILIGLALPEDRIEATQVDGPNEDNNSLVQMRHFLSRLSSNQVEIELLPAGVMPFNHDATPLNVSPSGSWHAG